MSLEGTDMPEMINISKEEFENLKERVGKLAREKSYLQLIVGMMQKLSATPGIDRTVDSMLHIVLESIGGANLIIYYLIDNDVYYADVFGKKMKLVDIEDPLVKKVFETREFMEFEHEFTETMMLTPEFTKAWTWVVPLTVGPDMVGVLKIESLHVAMREFQEYMPTFFNYSAFILKNEILGQTRLKKAYDELEAEVVVRRKAEEELLREREFARSLLESMADGVVACDAFGVLTLFNHTAKEWHGTDIMRLPAEEWAKHYDLYRMDGITPLPTEEIPLERAFKGEVVKDAGMAIVARGQAARFILANGNLIRDAEGKKLGAVVVMRDVTELRRVEEALRKSNEELEKKVTERTFELRKATELLQMELAERKATEEALRRSEIRFNEAQRIAHIGSWELDIADNILLWSDEIYRMFEIDPNKFIASYEAFLDAIHPEDRSAVNEAYTNSVKNHTPYAIEHRLLFPGGRIKYVHEQCETYYDQDGRPVRSIGTVQDITEQKRIENINLARVRLLHYAAAHTLSELLETTLNEAEALTGSCIGFYHFLEADQNTLSLQEWSTRTKGEFCKAEGKGLHYPVSEAGVWIDCIHERRPVIHNDYASIPHRKGLPQGHAPVIRELVVPVFRGDRIVAILGVGNKPNDYGPSDVEAISLLADLAWEIAERKRAEEALRDSENRYRLLVESAPMCIHEIDMNGRISSMNRAGLVMMGLKEEREVQGFPYLDAVSNGDRERISQLLAKAYEGEAGYFEFKAVGPGLIFKSCFVPIKREGRVIKLMGITEDITKRKQAEEEILRLNRLYNVLSRTNEMLVRAQNVQSLFYEACRIAVEQGGFLMAWIGMVDEETHFIKPAAMYGNFGDYLKDIRISMDDIPEGRGPTGSAMREGRHFVCMDIEHEPYMEPWRDGALAMGYRSSAAFPLRVGGSIKGTYTVYAPGVNWLNEDGIRLFDELAADISYALDYLEKEDLRKRAEEERKNLIQVLGERIKELTALRHTAFILQNTRKDIVEILKNIVDVLPAAWQYPDICAARIKYGDIEVKTANYAESKWTQNIAFITSEGRQGVVEVVYLEDRPSQAEGPFLTEERDLINSVAEMLKLYLERKWVEDALKLSYVYNRKLIEASPDPLVTISPEGKITDVNVSTESVTGHPRSELIGSDFSDYFTDQEKARAGYRQVFEKGYVKDYPLEIRHLDGHITQVLYNAVIYRDDAGKPIGVFAAARDISELKRAEAEIKKLNEELEQKVLNRTAQLEAANKELEAFSYSVSHDLRAPLRAISGFSQILTEDYLDKLDDEGKKSLNYVANNVRKMEQLIDDLLAFSRTGRKEMMQAEINMMEIARSVFEEHSLINPGRSIKFDLKELPPAFGDAVMIKQVFANLISNAFKFTRPREVAIIEVGGRIEGEHTIYYVKDNGVGFDMNYADKLFAVFQRLHSSTDFEGTGVGLAIVHKIVSRHGGKVWADGKENEGATFYFSLPKR